MKEENGLEALRTIWLGRRFLYLEEVDSTNDYLKRVGAGLPHGTVVIAGRQSAGKGRMGRSWSDGGGGCLSMSFLLQDLPTGRMPLLPLVCGLGVKRGVEKVSGLAASIKWSNDVLLGGGKICGILCESRLGKENFAIAGMGINLNQTREDFKTATLDYAESLFLATQKKYDKLKVASAILNEMEPVYEKFLQQGFESLLEEYKSSCVTLGKHVRVIIDGKSREGEALDILADGSLLCLIDGEKLPIRAGEASVRGLYGYI